MTGGELVGTSRWVVWSPYDRTSYFMKLREYCSFHNEIKEFLSQQYRDHSMIMQRVDQLPSIEYKPYYDDEEIGVWKLISSMIMYVLFPITYVYLYRRMRYLEGTRDKIHLSNRLYSSIAHLLKADGN